MARNLLLILLVSSSLWGCIPFNRYTALREAYNRVQTEQQSAKTELAQATSQLQQLQRETAPLKASHDALVGRVKELEAGLQQENREREALTASLIAKREARAAPTIRVPAVLPTVSATDSEREKIARAMEQALKGELAKGAAAVRRGDRGLSVELMEHVLYTGAGSSTIKPEGLKVLKRIADVLKEGAEKDIRVESYTDEPPQRSERTPSQTELSVARAGGVVRSLEKFGLVRWATLMAVGYGPTRATKPDGDVQAESRARRVEIVVNPAAFPR